VCCTVLQRRGFSRPVQNYRKVWTHVLNGVIRKRTFMSSIAVQRRGYYALYEIIDNLTTMFSMNLYRRRWTYLIRERRTPMAPIAS
jgi:hypothetical protein